MYKIFYINLDKDVERDDRMKRQLTVCNFDFERVTATWGKDVYLNQDLYDSQKSIAINGHDMTPAEIGCADSHLRVMKKIIDEQIPWAVVMEDDVIIPPQFKLILSKLDTKDAEYISFNYPPVGISFIRNWMRSSWWAIREDWKKLPYICLKSPYIVGMALYEGFRDAVWRLLNKSGIARFHRPLYLAGTYLISLAGARKIYDLGMPIYCPADRIQNQARVKKNLRLYGYVPLVVHQNRSDFDSNIAEKYKGV